MTSWVDGAGAEVARRRSSASGRGPVPCPPVTEKAATGPVVRTDVCPGALSRNRVTSVDWTNRFE